MIVADASVVTEAVCGSSARNLDVTRRVVRDAPLAPHVLDVEVVSALRALVLRGEIAEGVARGALQRLRDLPITRVAHGPLLPRSWELRHNITIYDAVYVALAEVAGATLLTADRHLANAPDLRCDVELLA